MKKSEAFLRLEKIAELDKIINSRIIDAKDDGTYIPKTIRDDLKLRGSYDVPKEILDESMDDPFLTSHLSKHKAMLTPGEALYIALRKKDDSVYRQSMGMSMGKILGMINNIGSVCQTEPEKTIDIDDFDQPRHIKIIVRMRSVSPDVLRKSAKFSLKTKSTLDTIQVTFKNGNKENIGPKYLKDNKSNIEKLITDGVIVRVVEIMSNNNKRVLLDKTASTIDDKLYLNML